MVDGSSRMGTRAAMITVIIALFAVLTGCIQSSDSENAVFSDPSGTPDFTLPDNPRVVALGWSDGEIALSLGVKPVAIYDWMAYGDKTKGVGSWAAPGFGTDMPQVLSAASSGAFNYQQIKELEPDLILNVRAKVDAKVTESLREIAPVVGAPSGTADFAVNWKTQTKLIGAAVGKKSEAAAQIADTEGVQQRIRQENPGFAGKTFVWGAKFGEAYGAYLPGDARFDTIAELGFVQFPPVAGLQTQGFFASVPAEKVASLDAQVAVLAPIGMPLQQLLDDNLIASLPVVRDGRAVMLAAEDPIVQAMSAGTPGSLKFALQGLAPKLAEAASKVG